MTRKENNQGFSLIELLLVLAIIGIISAVAIPTFLGSRRRARAIGDAQSNAQVLRMALEANKSDNGFYGAAGTYTWTGSTTPQVSTSPAPNFIAQGNSKMTYTLVIANAGLTYTLTVNDPSMANAVAYSTDQTGATTYIMH